MAIGKLGVCSLSLSSVRGAPAKKAGVVSKTTGAGATGKPFKHIEGWSSNETTVTVPSPFFTLSALVIKRYGLSKVGLVGGAWPHLSFEPR